ncbi:unnamed protein product [Zymoseptoria tritici ST99CH_3D7]|uniref:Uncharacterized protein n=2 Tax=Zymoseptoria tritici TaxID=1047171 RepID=A0A1X7S7N3_ZYMT9|nr:unnamed protein product [Zymoseptoria tritici ST99CH_3D7]SMR60441.1 unnamed protein product [Zymoseptoria tritici ST99CH_1E4]
MPSLRSSLALLAASVATFVSAQCLNTVAAYNPNVRTMTSNNTWFVVPVPKDTALAAAKEAYPLANLRLLDIQSQSTPDFFPNGFPEGMHPVLVTSGYTDDTRLTALQIDGALLVGTVFVPYVARGNSDAPLSASIVQYLAGPNGPLPNGLVPTVASPLLFGGAPVRLGQFAPKAAAYMTDASGTNSARVAWAILPNPISGPGVYPEALDFSFKTADSSRIGARTIKKLISTPILLPSGLCQRNTYYFNNATALPVLRNGQVTMGPAADGVGVVTGKFMQASPDKSGIYKDVDGFSACAQNVGNNPEDCDTAARTVDPASLD